MKPEMGTTRFHPIMAPTIVNQVLQYISRNVICPIGLSILNLLSLFHKSICTFRRLLYFPANPTILACKSRHTSLDKSISTLFVLIVTIAEAFIIPCEKSAEARQVLTSRFVVEKFTKMSFQDLRVFGLFFSDLRI